MLIEKTIHQIYLSLPNPKRFPHSWIVILSSINPVHNGREQASILEKAGGKNQKENLATKISNTGCHLWRDFVDMTVRKIPSIATCWGGNGKRLINKNYEETEWPFLFEK